MLHKTSSHFLQHAFGFIMFITAVCIVFLIKLKWPKTERLGDMKIGI